jgi:DNA repair protein RecO (recombination protein O)
VIAKTRGIVFRFTKYGDTSIIVNIFTDVYGLQSYIVNGVRSSSSKTKIALYQPLTLLDMVVYHKSNTNINRIKEVHTLYPYQSVQSDFRKASICIFISEILNKSIREESHAEEIFEFLYQSMMTLDNMEADFENFHLVFLIKLSRYLGFGAHQLTEITESGHLSLEEESTLQHLLNCSYDQKIGINNSQRRALLEAILRFFGSHIDALRDMKSLNVLREIMN